MSGRRCVCPTPDAEDCINLRYGLWPDDEDYDAESCECACHDELYEERERFLEEQLDSNGRTGP